jgi:DNA-binding response OmpR family regulator
VADDEREIVELMTLYLEKEGYEVMPAYDGKEALGLLQSESYHLAILDIMMPGLSGFQVIKSIREEKNLPVIILSARDDYSDKVLGLDIGADDYMTKPFNPLELLSRVKAQLRRSYELNDESSEDQKRKAPLLVGDLSLDLDCCELKKKGTPIQLTSTEYKMLTYLMSNVGRVFTKKQIFETVWEESYYGDENAIRVHISHLRDKIEDDPKDPKYLVTVRGLGYKFQGERK